MSESLVGVLIGGLFTLLASYLAQQMAYRQAKLQINAEREKVAFQIEDEKRKSELSRLQGIQDKLISIVGEVGVSMGPEGGELSRTLFEGLALILSVGDEKLTADVKSRLEVISGDEVETDLADIWSLYQDGVNYLGVRITEKSK